MSGCFLTFGRRDIHIIEKLILHHGVCVLETVIKEVFRLNFPDRERI